MAFLRRLQKHGNLREYMRYFLLLSLSIILLIGGAQYYFAHNALMQVAVANRIESMGLIRSTFDSVITQIDNSIALSQSAFQQYMMYYNQGQYTMLRMMQTQVNAIGSTQYVRGLCIYYRQSGLTLSSDLSIAELKYYHDTDFLLSLDDMDFTYSTTLVRPVNYLGSPTETVITLVRTLPVYYSAPLPEAYLVVDLDMKALSGLITSSLSSHNSYFCITSTEGELLVAAGEDQNYGEIIKRLHETEDPNTGGKQQVKRISDPNNLVLFVASENEAWHFAYIEPLKNITGTGFSLLSIGTMLVCGVVLLLSTVASFVFSRRIYRPIQSIYDIVGQGSASRPPKTKETDWILQRIDGMIRHNVRLEHENQLYAKGDKRWHLVSLLNSSPEEDVTEKLAELNLSLEPDSHFILLLAGAAPDTDMPLQAQVERTLDDPGLRVHFALRIAAEETALLLSGNDEDLRKASLRPDIRSALSINSQCPFGVSAPHTDLTALPTAYLQAKMALDTRLVKGSNNVGFFDDIDSQLYLPYPKDIETALFRSLKSDNWQDVSDVLNSFREYCASSNAMPEQIRGLYLQLLFTARSFLVSDARETLEVLYIDGCQILTFRYLDEIDTWMRSYFAKVFDIIHQMPKTGSAVIRAVCQYIDSHLGEALSAEELGSRFGYHPTTLRKMFRDDMRITFKKYVDMKRLEKSKELLVETDLKVQEIAEMMGYLHSQSFIAFFRSYEHVSPNEFRERHKSKLLQGGI